MEKYAWMYDWMMIPLIHITCIHSLFDDCSTSSLHPPMNINLSSPNLLPLPTYVTHGPRGGRGIPFTVTQHSVGERHARIGSWPRATASAVTRHTSSPGSNGVWRYCSKMHIVYHGSSERPSLQNDVPTYLQGKILPVMSFGLLFVVFCSSFRFEFFWPRMF